MKSPLHSRTGSWEGDFNDYVHAAQAAGRLVVQPRMGMADPAAMRAGLEAVRDSTATTVGTLTLDSYTRVGDEESARNAVRNHLPLNGYPITVLPTDVTADVLTGAGSMPVQVRHGSARPGPIFRAMIANQLDTSEGGPVSYCLPYGRVPLAESVSAWRDATAMLAAASPGRAHLETFGGCMLGQLCPPSMLVAISALEALFFAESGIRSVSLSYAQQTHADQDVGALRALDALADRLLPDDVTRHLVMYTYMGVFPATNQGAGRLLTQSAISAVRGGAGRLIVKTAAEAHRIPTVSENIEALEIAATAAALQHRTQAGEPDGTRSTHWSADADEILDEAQTLVSAVLQGGEDIGTALVRAFRRGILDVPFCLHEDNLGETQGFIDDDGRLRWASTGRLPLARSAPREPFRSDELLEMLNTVAEAADAEAARLGAEPHRTVIVGSGPRGIAVLERLATRLIQQPPEQPQEIVLIDPVEVGCGRIWRTRQSPHLLMNTVAGEVTMFSGPATGDGTPAPGAGPSLGQWWEATGDPDASVNGFAPRALYGRYLRFVVDTVAAHLPAGSRLRRITGRVATVEPIADVGRRLVRLAPGAEELPDRRAGQDAKPVPAPQQFDADYVVLTTGHARPQSPPPWLDVITGTSTRTLPADSVADLPVDQIAPGQTVGTLGLGLSFYDLVAVLTVGRGGRFVRDDDVLTYRPSGREPRIVGGSRSGVPLLARGHNQKPIDFRYQATLFTPERMTALRAEKGRLDLRTDLWPWLLAEMTLVHHETCARVDRRPEAAAAIRRCVQGVDDADEALRRLRELATAAGLPEQDGLDLDRLRAPFRGRQFTDAADFRVALIDLIDADLRQARRGNVGSPLKAALDVMRDTRTAVRAAVDHGGLTARSFTEDLLGWFNPLCAALAAGPPLIRLEELLALIDAGVVDVVGPSATFRPGDGRAELHSAQVGGPGIALDHAVDARIPSPDLATDSSPLTRFLLANGTITPYRHSGSESTGGVHVTTSPFHPVGAGEAVDRQISVLGIPTEFSRWFTQVGSGRPGHWGDFVADADAIAVAALAAGPIREAAPVVLDQHQHQESELLRGGERV
jgi:glutamate mutase epsilon subunit